MFRHALTVTVCVTILFLLPAAPVRADATAASPSPPAAQMTVLAPDTNIFRRGPLIDGVIDDGEWDTFYNHSAEGWVATAYADWDARCIYLGAKSNKPIDFLGVLDANDDGWFHGDDNYEFMATRGADGNLSLLVNRYESRSTKSPVATPVSEAEAAMVEMKSTKTADCYMIELRVPAALIRGFKLSSDRKIGLQIAMKTTADDSGWIPAKSPGEVRECTLVTKKFATLKPLVLGFDLKDARVARGEYLFGKFHLRNDGAESLDVRDFVVAGEGKSGDYLSSQKIRTEGLPPGKHVSQDVSTLIPSDMPIGTWAIGAEVSSAGARLGGALVSFEVVDPFEIELRLPNTPVRADVKDVTLGVNVRNNMRHTIKGTAKITLPIGWELWRNADTQDFAVMGDGGASTVAFKAKPPLGEMGEVVVKFEVTVGKETKSIEGKFTIVNP